MSCAAEPEKSSIELGKLADLAVLSDDPMKVDADRLAALKGVERIQEGAVVYRA
jgi:predicted amidohydrolase YtcJ